MDGIAAIYSELARVGYADGTIYIVSADNHVIELVMYAGFIVNAKCRGRTLGDIAIELQQGTFKQIRMTPALVKLDTINPLVILELAGYCAADTLKPSSLDPERLSHIISLIAYLETSMQPECLQAAELIISFIERFYPSFSFAKATIQQRIHSLAANHNITMAALNGDTIPDADRQIPGWIEAALKNVPSARLRGFTQYYLLLGESPQNMLGLPAKKDTSLGAKPGSVKLSKTMYPLYTKSSSITLFAKLQNVGDFHVIWHADNKRDLLITKTDFARCGLSENENVVVLFH
jgi:hypothetical protein